MPSITAPWLAELVLISYRSVRQEKRPPLPAELLASFVIFGTFSLIGNSQPRIAAVLGWGIVVATALNLAPEVVAPKSKNVEATS